MNKFKYRCSVLIISCVLILSIAMWITPRSKIYDHSFSDVVNYFSEKFTYDVTACVKRHPSVWGPNFLDTSTHYWIETERYIPEKELKFEAWYYQIGGEKNIFTIIKLNEKQTKITVRQIISFFREQHILNIIEKELKDFAIYGANYQSDTLFKNILKIANVSKDKASERTALRKAIFIAPVVFRARIDDVDMEIAATDGSKSWPVIKIRPSRILKGQWKKGLGFPTIVSNMYGANVDCSTGADEYIFFLEPDKELSRLCKKEIFRKIKFIPIK